MCTQPAAAQRAGEAAHVLKPSQRRSAFPVEIVFLWFVSYLKSELKPYPVGACLSCVNVLAATVTMLVINTLRVPGAGAGAYVVIAAIARELAGFLWAIDHEIRISMAAG